VEAIAISSRRTLLNVPWDGAECIPAEFVTPEIAFVMHESEVKVRRPPQIPSVMRMLEGSRALTARATTPCFFGVDIVGIELDCQFGFKLLRHRGLSRPGVVAL
jgi:hypothetical protein